MNIIIPRTGTAPSGAKVISETDLESVLTAGQAAVANSLLAKADAVLTAAGTTALRSIASHFSDSISIKDFGAVCDGVADDTLAVQAAVTAAVNQQKKLYSPGPVRLTAGIGASGSLTMYGDGSASSYWLWDASASTSGLSITLGYAADTFSQSVSISEMAFFTKNALNGTAIYVKSPTTGGDRVTVRVWLSKVTVRGYKGPLYDGWANGMGFDGVARVIVDACCIIGRVGAAEPNYITTTGVLFNNASHSTPHPTELLVSNSFIAYAQYGILAGDMEGLFVRGCNIFGVTTGIQAGDGLGDYPHALITDTHVNAAALCININRMFQAFITNNLLYSQLSTSVPMAIQITNLAKYFLIRGNSFENLNSSLAQNTIVVSSGAFGLVDGNMFRRSNSVDGAHNGLAIWFTSGSSNCVATNANVFDRSQVSRLMLDEGTSNIMAFSVQGLPGFSRNNDGIETRYGSSIVTLNSSGVGMITFDTPFKKAQRTAVISNGDPGFSGSSSFDVVQTSCTASTLVFQVQGVSGGTPTVRVNWIAYGD